MNTHNILILGSGGREHTFAWKIAQSEYCNDLFIAPGNAGTLSLGTNVDLSPNDFPEIKEFIKSNNITMVVVGPEEPLVRGVYDYIKSDAEIGQVIVVGPSKEGAQLEGSKAYSKVFMDENNIPTAGYAEFTSATYEQGCEFIDKQTPPIVLKADGLAAGKGVLIIDNKEEAKESLKEMLSGKFGEASTTVVIEEFLDGIEFSVFVLTDGESYQILPVAKDYKRIGEGDTGLNTGGMGAISPPPFVDDVMMKKVEERVVIPTVNGIKKRGITYKGFVFIGLIRVDNEPFVIEYNCRMGDPETEAVLPRMKNDLVELFDSLDKGNLSTQRIDEDPRSAVTVMMVSGGYPEAYEKGKVISGHTEVTDSIVFHAGTKDIGGIVTTNGGRVMSITSFGENFEEALKTSYNSIDKISFEKMNFRKDIGFDLK